MSDEQNKGMLYFVCFVCCTFYGRVYKSTGFLKTIDFDEIRIKVVCSKDSLTELHTSGVPQGET